ncbi:MAG: homoserine dehydrogenase [Oscillospiraceae bacterium]|nr:homoserine dehydrogenase [Oscillospiraceae bacterium]
MKVAVLGFGTIGFGVYRMLEASPGLEPGPVLVREGKKKEPFQVTSLQEILDDPGVGAVVEVMGGVEPAFTYARETLRSGRHFVTANKALVAVRGLELAAEARQSGAAFLFGAACGGGVPLLHNLALAVKTDEIRSVSGILNGTTNYMLHAMQTRGMNYDSALREAQTLGYAEADPTADVTGMDAARKIALACAVAYGLLPEGGLDCEGIDHLSARDVADFQSRGLTCRLIARGVPAGGTVAAYVEPVLFGAAAPECSVTDNYNMARYEGRFSGPMVFMGQGAGRYPTASSVLRDLSGIQAGQRAMLPPDCAAVQADNDRESHAYYVRLGADRAADLPVDRLLSQGETVRVITKPISVHQMHVYARKERRAGRELFFAAVEG